MLMLDDYRHVYIGQAWDMRLFIKAHGSGIKQCDRLIWGHDLVLSIDAFRAMDTIRFAARTINADSLEARLVRTFRPITCSTASAGRA